MAKTGIKNGIVGIILCLIFICSSFFTVAAFASDENDPYSLALAGSTSNKIFSSADILEAYLGETLIEAERDYLVSFGGVDLEYNDGITTANVSVSLDDGKLSVIAYEYSYIAKNGSTVIWVPKAVTLGEDRIELSKSIQGYRAEFEGVDENGELQYVNVEYSLSVNIEKTDIENLLNKAKNDVAVLEETMSRSEAEYENALKEYEAKSAAYAFYVKEKAEYDKASSEYKAYLSAYRLYKEKLDAYNEYLSDLEEYKLAKAAREEYEEKLAIYNEQYDKYVSYLVEKKNYDKSLSEYERYLDKLRRFRAGMLVINYTDRTMTEFDRSLRDAIYGTVVDTVMNERETLESRLVGAPSAVIDLAGSSTENLRTLLNGYFTYTTEQSRYSYYLEHYESLKKSFVDLFISLDYLYTNPSVRAALYEAKRDEKYRILVAQLYLLAHAISDEPIKSVDPELVAGGKDADKYKQFTYTEDFTIDVYEYTIEDILGSDVTLTDTDMATPLNEPFPTEMTCPVMPEAVEEPVEPEYAPPVTEVRVADDPGEEPERVADPGEAPNVADHPGEEPEEYVPPKEFISLIASKNDLTQRSNSVDEDYLLTLNKTVLKKFIDQNEINVKFYSQIGGDLLYETVVDAETPVHFVGETPEKIQDAEFTYVFDGWQNSDGERVNLSALSADAALYPIFKEELRSYTVYFDVNGEVTEFVLNYGEIPSFGDVTPGKEDTEYLYYTFKGWDKELKAVSSDITYTAQFESQYIVPTTDSGASVVFTDEDIVVNYGICFDRRLKLGRAIEKAEKSGAMTVVTPFCRLELSYSTVKQLYSLGAAEMFIDITERAGDVCGYRIEITDKSGAPLSDTVSVRICDPILPFEPNSRLKLYTFDENGEREYSKFSITENGGLVFNAASHVDYTLSYEYNLGVTSNDFVKLTAGGSVYSSGESVEFDVAIKEGYKLQRLYYLRRDGKEVDLKTPRLTMPGCDTVIVAVAVPITYKITFVNGNVPISIIYYEAGIMPTLPETPIKVSDGEYNYTFVGWSQEVVAVEADATYYAVYDETPVEKAEPIPEKGFWEKIVSFFVWLFEKITNFVKKIFS